MPVTLITRRLVCCPPPGIPLVGNLRTRLLALHVLEAVLPACESGVEDDQMAQVCIFFLIGGKCFSYLQCDSPKTESSYSLLFCCKCVLSSVVQSLLQRLLFLKPSLLRKEKEHKLWGVRNRGVENTCKVKIKDNLEFLSRLGLQREKCVKQ